MSARASAVLPAGGRRLTTPGGLQRHLRRAHILGAVAAAAFAVDAGVHATSAGAYDPAHGGLLTEGNLFRLEALAAAFTGIGLIIRPTARMWVLGLAVATTALGAVVLYRYVNVGAIGPFPNLYEPTWQVPGKLLSAYAEAAAVLVAYTGFIMSKRGQRRSHRAGFAEHDPASPAATPSTRP
ncbi:MAG: hypothetical protein JOZ75_14695 [Candidatus Dormibacteraeota bacterium]|nr:hypothetical protein [Candidatus Dormibacteraeota bacterium]